MKKKTIYIAAAAAVVLAAVLIVIFATRGGGNKASAMWLVRAEGTVSVTDDGGSDVPVRPAQGLELRLGLYNGYAVDTRSESFGWINLDDTKLTKLDEDSAVTINRDGKALELVLHRGSLFFNVTKPLEDDETLEIRSSSMVMAVRGTSGWVQTIDDETFNVYIIEGKVRVTAQTPDAVVPAVDQVAAGETARLSIADGVPSITLGTFDESDVPDFVLEEAREDGELREKLSDIGVTVAPGGSQGPDNPGDSQGPDNPGGPGGSDDPGGSGSDPGGTVDVNWDTQKGDDDGHSETYGDITWTIRTQRPELTHDVPNLYFEVPVFEGPEPGIQAINDFLKRRCESFLSLYPSGFDTFLTNHFGDGQIKNYIDRRDLKVEFPLEGIVVVSMYKKAQNINYELDENPEYFTFDLNTGKRMDLWDFIDGTNEEFCEMVVETVRGTEYNSSYLESYFTPIWLEVLSFCPRSDCLMLQPTFSMVGLGAALGFGSFQIEVPLASRWENGGADRVVPVPEELASRYTGNAALLTPEDAARLAGKMREMMEEAQIAYNNESERAEAFGGRACLFTLADRPAVLMVCGGYDPASPEVLEWPVKSCVVYPANGDGWAYDFSHSQTGYIYDGGFYTIDFNGYSYNIYEFSGVSVKPHELANGEEHTTPTGFGRHYDALNNVTTSRETVGMFDVEEILSALEDFAGARG